MLGYVVLHKAHTGEDEDYAGTLSADDHPRVRLP